MIRDNFGAVIGWTTPTIWIVWLGTRTNASFCSPAPHRWHSPWMPVLYATS